MQHPIISPIIRGKAKYKPILNICNWWREFNSGSNEICGEFVLITGLTSSLRARAALALKNSTRNCSSRVKASECSSSSTDLGKSANFAINFSKQYGNLATFYASGLARRTATERVGRLLEDVYGKKLNRTRLVLHFGSGKPFSDIDLFVVSNNIPSTYDPWLDVRAYKTRRHWKWNSGSESNDYWSHNGWEFCYRW